MRTRLREACGAWAVTELRWWWLHALAHAQAIGLKGVTSLGRRHLTPLCCGSHQSQGWLPDHAAHHLRHHPHHEHHLRQHHRDQAWNCCPCERHQHRGCGSRSQLTGVGVGFVARPQLTRM